MFIQSIQIGVFFKHEQERPDLLFYEINSALDSVFDSMPTIMDMPFDYPIVRAQSGDKTYGLQISRKRADLFIFPQEHKALSPLETFNSFKNQICKYYSYISSNLQVVRVGFNSAIFDECHNNVQTLCDKLLKTPSPDCTEFCLRTNAPQESHGFRINNIKTIVSGELDEPNRTLQCIWIKLDTNNIPHTDHPLSKPIIDDFLKISLEQLSNVSDLILLG